VFYKTKKLKYMNVLGLTLARGGSKGIPKKNIKSINGKPLIAHTIEAALTSGIFTDYIVSTDSPEISKISKNYGAKTPFLRPDELSGDTVLSRDCVKHAVLECEKIYNIKYDYVIELPCVAPLRTSLHIQEAFNQLISTGADSVISVVQMQDKHPVRMKRIINGQIYDFCSEYPEGEASRRQDLELCYLRNGAIYSMTRDCIVEKFSRHGDVSKAYIMDENVSVNVDTMLDFKLAEVLLKENK